MRTVDWSWRRRVTVTAIALMLVAAACGPAATSSPTGPTGAPTATVAGGEIDSVVWAGKNSVGSLDPHLSYDSGTTNYVTYAECEGLAVFDENTQVQPHLAESWLQVDALTYTIQLRQGVTFWDGTPVTADDVVFSITRINDPDLASPLTGLTSTIELLGTEDFARLRVGVGRGDTRRDLADHVLARFDPNERDGVAEMVDRAADAVELFVAEGIGPVMNRFNRKEDGE